MLPKPDHNSTTTLFSSFLRQIEIGLVRHTTLGLIFVAGTILQTFPAAAADTTPPVTTSTLSPATPNGKNDWYTVPVTVTLSATDLESGVKSINYKINASSWQTVNFSNSLNLAPNPSMETIDLGNTPIIKDWSATVLDGSTTYTRDTANYAPSYDTTSARIVTSGTGWHGVNNQGSFATASPYANMHASVWLKTTAVTEWAFFKVYVVSQDGLGNISYTYLTQSGSLTGTTDWTEVDVDFVVNDANAIGVYLDIGLTGNGTVWADAVTINNSNVNTSTQFTVGSDGTNTIEYYAVDHANNTEAHTCTSPVINCKTIKIDQNPPGSWYDSGAIRGLGGSEHEVYVYSNVQDGVSGISGESNKYMYHVDSEPGFGRFANLLYCNTPWTENDWVDLASPAFTPGDNDVQLMTQKTDLCNSNWKICKTVRFYAEDMAGNSKTKDFCLNGPWIQFIGGGMVKSNGGIDMIAEPEGDNSDGLVEIGNNLYSFFSTSKDWLVYSAPEIKNYTYDKWHSQARPTPTTVSGLGTSSGVYKINSNFELKNTTIPNSYKSATFNHIYFINGDLKISNNVETIDGSAALFIVKGNVEIDEKVTLVEIGIFADGDIYSAYNLAEGSTTSTLDLYGVYSANKFIFQRTLQGTNNSKDPAERFTYAPKLAWQLADYLGTNSIKWISAN